MQCNATIEMPKSQPLNNIQNQNSLHLSKNIIIAAVALLAIGSAIFFTSGQVFVTGVIICSVGVAGYGIKKIFDAVYPSGKPGLHDKIKGWFKGQAIGDQSQWWLEINRSKKLIEFKKNWKKLTANPQACKSTSHELRSRCKNFSLGRDDFSGLYNKPLGTVHGVPDDFSMWMPGVAFTASYLAAKKNIEGLFVCQTLEALATQIKEIALNEEDRRCSFLVGTFQSGLKNQFPFDFEPNFPQHKSTVCVEKKAGLLTIALLESMPAKGLNDKIDPVNLTNNLWNGYGEWDKFNNIELAFRAIVKACQYANYDAKLLCSQVVRQMNTGCETFAVSDAISFLRDPDFFSKISCSSEILKLDMRYQVEYITQLPPEFMIGLQSDTLIQDYMKAIDVDQPLIHKKKSLKEYFVANRVGVQKYGKIKFQNHYIVKKSYKYLIFLVEALDKLGRDRIKKIIEKTLVTNIDKNLFPDSPQLDLNLEVVQKSNFESVHQESCKVNKPTNLSGRIKLII
jgi:hypothetical protein